MNNMKEILVITLILIPSIGQAATLKATCDSLKGTSFHYIQGEFANEPNENLGKANNPIITYDTDKKTGSVSMADALGNRTNEVVMPFDVDGRHLSLLGSYKNTPELFTLYLNEAVLFYTTSQITNPAIPKLGDTPMGAVLYTKCKIDISGGDYTVKPMTNEQVKKKAIREKD